MSWVTGLWPRMPCVASIVDCRHGNAALRPDSGSRSTDLVAVRGVIAVAADQKSVECDIATRRSSAVRGPGSHLARVGAS